jgi:hypothetical protein
MLSISKKDRDPGLKGFGGWLIFFAVVTTIGTIRDIVLFFGTNTRAEQVGIALGVMAMVYGLYILITLQNHTPIYWTSTLAVLALMAILLGEWQSTPRTLIWMLYWIRSERVLITFGKNGLGGKFGIGERLPAQQELEAERTPT